MMLPNGAADRSAVRAESGQQQHHLTPQTATLPVPAGILQRAAELIATQHERERQAEQRGFRRGYRAGYAAAESDIERRWREFAVPAARSLAAGIGLQERRWRLRGEKRTQATFSRPHPADFTGRRSA